MKRVFVLGIVLFGAACSVYAQGFYFDIGLGLGKAWTKVNGDNVREVFSSAGKKVDEAAADIGLKAGYGPLGSAPIYIVGEISLMAHRIYNSSNEMLFTSYLIGPGILFHPMPSVQLSAGIGYSYTGNETDIDGYVPYDSEGGFAWNIAAAVDLGKRPGWRWLLGAKYFNATNKLKTSLEENSSMVSVFVRYAYRHL